MVQVQIWLKGKNFFPKSMAHIKMQLLQFCVIYISMKTLMFCVEAKCLMLMKVEKNKMVDVLEVKIQ